MAFGKAGENGQQGHSYFEWETDLRTSLATAAHRFGLSVGEVVDAELLLRFAMDNGKTIDPTVVERITILRGVLEGAGPQNQTPDQVSAMAVAFRNAYRQLAGDIAPVTAQTVRNTDQSYGRKLIIARKQRSEAMILSLKLWIWSICTLIFILVSEVGNNILLYWFPMDAGTEDTALIKAYLFIYVLQYLLPFAYGLLGACAFLLKSSHFFARERTFDRGCTPEYYNRMLLGLIAGGTIQMFVENIGSDQGEVYHFSGAAMGFIAGYQVDFLYQAIERIIKAVLPKIGIESVRRVKPTAVKAHAVSIEALVEKYEATQDAELKAALLGHIRSADGG